MVRLWVDQGAGKSATHIFNGKSFQELLDFLGIKEPKGDPRIVAFGGALMQPKSDGERAKAFYTSANSYDVDSPIIDEDHNA
jgi:hypothetical protein